MLFTESGDKCTYVFVCLKKKKLYHDYSGLELLVKSNNITIIPIKVFYFVNQHIGLRWLIDCSILLVCAYSLPTEGAVLCFSITVNIH